MSATRAFDNVENKHTLYRKEDYMKMFKCFRITRKKYC